MPSAKKIKPKTISEAVDHLITALPLKDRAEIAKMDEKDIIELNHSSLGLYIRSEFGLWAEKTELLKDCCSFAEDDNLDSKMVSAIIITELRKKLQETHRIRIVK